jgi:acyl-CoA reductase-like NAD-dependent aldehyde dehydrogenase/nicotinamidase-related amidase
VTVASQGAALLLVDLQRDFLERAGLHPEADALCARAAMLLGAARRRGLPVVHAHTRTRADGSDRMPHWQRQDIRQCVDGTPGAEPPPELAPAEGELVLRKTHFSAFGDARLEPWLRQRGVTRLIVAGVYLHGCVRSTVLDAYESGFAVCVVDDAVGSTEPLHAEVTRVYLDGRAASFARVVEVIGELDGASNGEPRRAEERALPVAMIEGVRRGSRDRSHLPHRNPCRIGEVLWRVPVASAGDVAEAAAAGERAGHSWRRIAPAERAALLARWAGDMDDRRAAFTDLIVRETAKPRRFAEEEIGRAVAHVRIAAELARDPEQTSRSLEPGVAARRRPLGVVGLVTPWNNPMAIPVGKIAPALAFGNAVVLKPAPEASATALAILESLERAGCPHGLVNLVLGDGATARALCREPHVAAISVTGSLATGQVVAAHCAVALKPFQAELGGNNAALVLADADLETAAAGLARAAFGFAGQRCTAIRRFVVERRVAARFETLVCEASASLANGAPDDPATEVGPLISAAKRDRVLTAIDRAVAAGARLAVGGVVPAALSHGAWMTPAVLADVDPLGRLAQEETFGPVAVLLPADDLEHALALANGVPQGLVLAAHTRDDGARARILEAAEAGILQLRSGPLAIHPRAPFAGWKASGFGPPEHGVWDADFYARAQAVYTNGEC